MFNTAGGDRIATELTRNASLGSLEKKRRYIKSQATMKAAARTAAEKQLRKTESDDIRKAMNVKCCEDQCNERFALTTLKSVRQWFHSDGGHSRSEGAKTLLVREIIEGATYTASTTGRAKLLYSIVQTTISSICRAAMTNILGLSKWKWNVIKHGPIDELDETVMARKLSTTQKEELIYRFLSTTAQKFSESLPNTTDRDLPANFTMCEVHNMFCMENPSNKVSMAYFLRTWQVLSDFPVLCY
jgi:hypothetical protein